MEIHAEYFLKCGEAAKWLNTPQPVTGVPKEFLDGAYAVTSTLMGIRAHVPAAEGRRNSRAAAAPSAASSSASTSSRRTSPVSQRVGGEFVRKRAPAAVSDSKRGRKAGGRPAAAPLRDRDVRVLERGFPELSQLGGEVIQALPKALLYVPVRLHEHFVFGIAVGCPVPPPDGVSAHAWKPLVNRFVLDAGRKCCMMFSYFAEGSIVVSADCFDEVGDHLSDVTFFEPTPVVGPFPKGIRGGMKIFEKRDCPACTTARVACMCPVNDRVDAIVKLRQQRNLAPEHGPAHAGSSYRDENVTIQTYPYWAQVLDEYKWSRMGSYCVQVRYSPVRSRSQPATSPMPEPSHVEYRSTVVAEPRAIVDKMLRVALFEKGISALKPPATDVRWETSSTIAVNADNQVRNDNDPVNAVCFTDWHKLPGFQEDYLLVAPSNIVSGAHARAELARAEAERLAAQRRSGVPVLPSWASGREGVFEHILNESGPELDMIRQVTEGEPALSADDEVHAQMLRQMPQASAFTEMRPHHAFSDGSQRRPSGESGRRESVDGPLRLSSVESNARGRSSVDSNARSRSSVDSNARTRASVDSNAGTRASMDSVGSGSSRGSVESNRRSKEECTEVAVDSNRNAKRRAAECKASVRLISR